MMNGLLPAAAGDEGTYVCTLSEDLVLKAEDELKEKAEWRLRDIQALRDMVTSYPGKKP